MAKKRTRKQKTKAKHSFTLSWDPSTSEAKSSVGVKRQITNSAGSNLSNVTNKNYSIDSAQSEENSKIRKNIFKSLILAAFILGIQLVLYSFWK
jgi:hypothetical protein